MTTAIIFHEVQDGAVWAKAWKKGPGSRHEMFGKIGVKCRNFRDPDNPNSVGVMAEIPDMAAFQQLLQSDEGKKAMQEDGLKVETMRSVGRVHTVAGGASRSRRTSSGLRWRSSPADEAAGPIKASARSTPRGCVGRP